MDSKQSFLYLLHKVKDTCKEVTCDFGYVFNRVCIWKKLFMLGPHPRTIKSVPLEVGVSIFKSSPGETVMEARTKNHLYKRLNGRAFEERWKHLLCTILWAEAKKFCPSVRTSCPTLRCPESLMCSTECGCFIFV